MLFPRNQAKVLTVLYPQTDDQTKRQNSTIENYFRAFVNYKQDNYALLLLMAEFAFNNLKNANTSHMFFELNYSYRTSTSDEQDVDPCFQSKLA